VVWANEKGIKIMRSHITTFKGDRVERAGEWRRISAIERPSEVPEEMAASWKVRMEWVDLAALEKDAETAAENDGKQDIKTPPPVKNPKGGGKERLIVGWGGVIWVIDVYGGDGLITYHSPARNGRGRATESNEGKAWGWAEIRNV